MTKDEFERAAQELGYKKKWDVLVDEKTGESLLTLGPNGIHVYAFTVDACEKACLMARAIEKKVKESPPKNWTLYDGEANHRNGIHFRIDNKTPSFWDDLIALAQWAKTRTP